jgi:DNA-binding CsgD family transcriptional regulator
MNNEMSPKHREILQLLADGLTSEEIADGLGNSKKTIDATRKIMLSRMNAKNVVHLVSIGYKKGFLKI